MSPLLLCNKVAFTSSQSARIIMLYHCGFVSGSRCVNVINFLPEIWQNRRWDSVHDLPVYKYWGPDHLPYWKATLCEACKDAFHVSDTIGSSQLSLTVACPGLATFADRPAGVGWPYFGMDSCALCVAGMAAGTCGPWGLWDSVCCSCRGSVRSIVSFSSSSLAQLPRWLLG